MFQPSNGFGDPLAFRTIFFEEAQEHLANVEAILLRMDTDAPHPDDLNAIFRAVHSIKGSAAMLGCSEIAALTHLQENLLDLLRKGERPIDGHDVNAMLKAGDVLRLQVLHRRGAIADAPDAAGVEALLRDRVAQPATDAADGRSGPVTRSFRVRLGPLVQPIDELELDMMLTGLSEMGTVQDTIVDNRAGGTVAFDLLLQGAAADLQSVLSLVVAPELIAIETLGVAPAVEQQQDAVPAVQPAPELHAVAPAAPAVNEFDEFFVDPAEFRKKKQAPAPEPEDEFFIDPAEFRKRNGREGEESRHPREGEESRHPREGGESRHPREGGESRHPREGGDPGHFAGAQGAEALDSRLRGNDGADSRLRGNDGMNSRAHGNDGMDSRLRGNGVRAPLQSLAPEEAPGIVDLFVSPEEFRSRKAAPVPAVAPMPIPVASATETHDPVLPVAQDATYIRVSTEKIDLLVNLVGELVITEAMLARTGALAEAGADAHYGSNTGLADLSRHTRNLQEAVLAIRMLPISNVFQRFPRMVHELSHRLGKKVDLRMVGEGTELDRGLIEKISDPLTHLVRNAIDHGLEAPEARVAAGKPATGTVTLKASQRGGNIVIEVTDDGRGLDRARILARAKDRGIAISPEAPDADVFALIFEAGFSTAEKITDVSGRGVGMDVVRRNIQALGGTVDLGSVAGQGTRITVSVPLTLAIMEAMTIAIGGETYVLPLAAVMESLSVVPKDLHTLPGHGDTLRVREEYLPVLHLAQLFPPRQPREHGGGIAVIVETDGAKAALLVDELVGQQQVVVKSLETNFRRVPGLSGATVMGDGSVALILDVAHLVRLSGREGAMLL